MAKTTNTERTHRTRARKKGEVPDVKIVAFPRNWRGDDSIGAHLASWGPDHDLPPMTAGEVVLQDTGKLIALFTLHVLFRRGLGFYLRDCKLVQWGPGERVLLPQRTATKNGKTYSSDLLVFDTNRGARCFEEAALAAARHAVAALRATLATDPPANGPPADDAVPARDPGDVPF